LRTASARAPTDSRIDKAFLVLGTLTILSGIAYAGLKRDDGNAVSRHNVILPAE